MRSYSVYQAKAKLSEIIRLVKHRQFVTITERGAPVAQVGPIPETSFEERLRAMTERGEIIPPTQTPARIRPIKRIPGALERFLKDRE